MYAAAKGAEIDTARNALVSMAFPRTSFAVAGSAGVVEALDLLTVGG